MKIASANAEASYWRGASDFFEAVSADGIKVSCAYFPPIPPIPSISDAPRRTRSSGSLSRA